MNGSTRVVEARVSLVGSFGDAGCWIDLLVPCGFRRPLAGQFVQVACDVGAAFRLNRPFSIASWREREEAGEIGIHFAIVGDGSQWLASRKPGERVRLIGPLGHPFEPVPGHRPILIAGGRGIAPLLLLASQLAASFPDGRILYGARNRSALYPATISTYPIDYATLDGSSGIRGNVIDLLGELDKGGGLSAEPVSLYACGPMAMLEAVSRYANQRRWRAQVSLETTFGCGTGLCAGCAVPIRSSADAPKDRFERYAFACCDGPVFDADKIEWQEGFE